MCIHVKRILNLTNFKVFSLSVAKYINIFIAGEISVQANSVSRLRSFSVAGFSAYRALCRAHHNCVDW